MSKSPLVPSIYRKIWTIVGWQIGFEAYVLCVSKEIEGLVINFKFGPLPVLLHDHIPSQSIRNEKIHWIRYPGCQNRTIFKDFRGWNLKFVLHTLRDCNFSALNLILSHFLCSYMIIYHLNQSEMTKYIELGTLNVKIGPFSRILGLETSSLHFKIYAIATFRLWI